jgi:hypothetical protein
MRWIETGCKVWGLEDYPRHFLAFVSLIGSGLYSWYITGVNAYYTSNTWEPGTRFFNCGEETTERTAKKAAEKHLSQKDKGAI